MNAALWSTVVVAIAGYVTTFLTAWYASRRAFHQVTWQKNAERRDQERGMRADLCREFLRAWRVVRNAEAVGGEQVVAEALLGTQRAAAGLELHAPQLTPEPLMPALAALEHLVGVRQGVGSVGAITAAEADCDQKKAVLADAMRDLLGVAVAGDVLTTT